MRRIAMSCLALLALVPATAGAAPDDPALSTLDPATGTVFEWQAAKFNLPAAWASVPAGTVLVAAAADDPTADQGEPANLLEPSGRGLVATAATAAGTRARWAGFGSGVSVAAYGVGIFGDFPANQTTLDRECDCRTSLGGSDGFAYLSG